MAKKTFLGIRQVLSSTFNSITDKKGYLWFVRKSADDTYGDIYFGSRHYGHFGNEETEIETIKTILSDAGVVDASGNTVDIMSLIEESQLESGIAIDVTGGTISVNVADETDNAVDAKTTNKNFLKVTDNNELEVKGVDSDATVLSKDITIEGGEWATAVKKVYTSGKLPSGTTLQEFLTAMLCVEKWGGMSNFYYNFSTVITKPTIAMSTTSTSVPVGTKISPSATIGTDQIIENAKVSGLTYGYSTNGTSKSSTASTYTQTKAPTSSGSKKLVSSYSGFVEKSGDTYVSATSSDGTAKDVYVKNGTNTFTASETGLTYTPSAFDNVTVYNVSNLGSVGSTGVSIDVNYFTTPQTPTNSGSSSITGYYPVFYGSIGTTNATDSDAKTAVSSFDNTHSSTPTSVTTPASTGAFVIAVPTGNTNYNKTTLTLKDSKDMSFGASHTFVDTIVMLNNVETVSYRFFYITNANATTGQATWTVSFS